MAVNSPKKILVAGAGVAGLAVAARLAAAGHQVTVIEKNPYPGGKLSSLNAQGFRFDMGPSLFTLPSLMHQLFSDCGKNLQDYFKYQKLDEITRYFFSSGKELIASSDSTKFAKSCEVLFGEPAPRVQRYLMHCQKLYNLTADLFLAQSLHQLKGFMNLKTLRLILKVHHLHLFSTLDAFNKKKFRSPELVQLFNRYATYNGSSPYQTPATLSVIPHLEFGLGAYLPQNGMHDITQALYKLCIDLGVEFHFSRKITSIHTKDNKVSGVQTADAFFAADQVVSNADVYQTYTRLMPHIKPPQSIQRQLSSSGLIFYWGINRNFPQLGLHNIFFGNDYPAEFRFIFENAELPDDITVYLNITSKHCPNDAPEGSENWFVMVNVPPNPQRVNQELRRAIKERVLKKLSSRLGVDISAHIVFENHLDPSMIEEKTGSHMGALYGSASNSMFSAFLRQKNRADSPKGLYFCGGSVHPGGGIPLCLFSAGITAGIIAQE
ncbi:MAG: 1-hydroxycarotenoid 3,4-desaturase CrtD [Bacteroidota bacterium]|jgi:phytoene desaturase